MTEITLKSQNIFLHSQIGKIVPVLFEAENSDKYHQGYSPNYTLIKIYAEKNDKSLRRKIFYVKIVGLENDYCLGELIK